MRDSTNDQGFSLIELLLVIVVLGILATVVVMSVGGMTSGAAESACLADQRTLEKAGQAYFAQTGAETIPATLLVDEPFEQTLVDRGFLRQPSTYHDLDADGRIVVIDPTCTL